MKIRIKIKGKFYDVELSEISDGKIKIRVGEKEFVFEPPDPLSSLESQKSLKGENGPFQKRDFQQKEIRSPIAGTVSEIFVKEGEKIEKEQKIVLLSAMKMENEIISDFSGKIKEIRIKEGEQVKRGQVLVVVL